MKLMELYQDKIVGAIRGLDRIRFRGMLRLLPNQIGLRRFMSYTNILLKDFSDWVEDLTSMIRESCEAKADELDIEARYLRSSWIAKENLARNIAAEKGLRKALFACSVWLSLVLHRWLKVTRPARSWKW
ncbi:hypothetical protein ACFL3Q_08980 [Planctomycetota bacterium]